MMFLAALTLVSGLSWYTDLDEAKAAAHAQHKPILSLRLLGNLDEELSCANSRFFRTILYTDPRIAAAMREKYILHWKSVRPVPKVTIDFGDGRVITTTITGNSIHYILDENGRVIDAIPGMYTPNAFLAALLSGAPAPPPAVRVAYKTPDAIAASSLTATKGIAETPMLNALSLESIREHSRPKTEAEFERMITTLKSTLAEDTRRNETELRPVIRRWIAEGNTDVDKLNERVYTELFLTPSSDPWLGLLPAGVYTGIDNDGVTTSSAARADTSSHRLSGAPAQSSRSHR